ncbi:hypothetical protein RHMOL_Rhmol13G0102100 [Rhododendron molle]|uniref:Uncharacterized protein n=1 Tax=Rhododendron molle TaxID=49168 RepID=A0ACC0L6L9_RHOML|nr:hypothetical protein RHMOL_Rhmol13G0102100 [Rhododendron molle]
MASSTIKLKLLVDAKSNKVVYAEAKKDFVDFLFGLLELPIGTVLSLLVNRGKSGPGSLAKIHASVKTLDVRYSSSSRKDVVEGHVKGVVTYMVMDDLTVKPMSTISSISILNTMWVKDFGSLVEKNVVVDMNKGLELLKVSFESTTVVSDVFLPAVEFPSTSSKRGRFPSTSSKRGRELTEEDPSTIDSIKFKAGIKRTGP